MNEAGTKSLKSIYQQKVAALKKSMLDQTFSSQL